MGNNNSDITVRIAAEDAYSKVFESATQATKRLQDESRKMTGDMTTAGQAVQGELASLQQLWNADAAAAKKSVADILAAEQRKMDAIRRSNAEVAKLGGATSSDRLSKDFNTLGIKSALDIQAEKARAVAAFEAIKKSGVASANEVERAHKAMQARLNEIDKSPQKIATGLAGVSQMLVGFFALDRIVAFTKASFEASLAVDSITSKLKVMAGSSAGAAKEWEYIRGEAKRLGLDLQDTAAAYSSFAVSAKGTSMEGAKTREMFTSVAEAATALHLPAEQSSRVLYQFQQMLSKGTVNMEDLKTASESFPGLLGAVASALGITTAELMKQMQAGTLMASDVLPKLAIELHKTYGTAAEEAATQGRAAMNRFKTETFEMMAQVGQDVGPGIIVIGKFVTTVAKGIMVTVQTAGAAMAAVVELTKTYFDPSMSLGQKITKVKQLAGALVDTVRESTDKYFGEVKKSDVADKQSLEEKTRNDQRRRNEAKKTGADLAKINAEYAKLAGDNESQLTGELDKQYEERKKATTDYYNQKKAYAANDIEEVTFEQVKKLKLIDIEKQHARDVEIVKAQSRVKTLENLKNEVDMETLLIQEAVAKKVMTEQQGEQRITALTVAAARVQYEAKKAVTDKIVEIYGKDGEEYKKALKDQESAHKEFLSANTTAYKKYSDQIKRFDQEIKDFRMSIQEKIRDAQQKTMTDAQKYADDQKRFDEALAKSKQALAAKDYDEAAKYNKQAEELAGRLLDKKAESDNKKAKIEEDLQKKLFDINEKYANKTEMASDKRTLDRQSKQFYDVTGQLEKRDQLLASEGRENEILKAQREAKEKLADIDKERAATQAGVANTTQALNQVEQQGVAIKEAQKQEVVAARSELQKIADMKIENKSFQVGVDGSSLDAVKSAIADLTRTETKTIIVRTVGANGEPSFSGSIIGMATGGIVGGAGIGDTQLRMLDPREGVLRPEAMSVLGPRIFSRLNALRGSNHQALLEAISFPLSVSTRRIDSTLSRPTPDAPAPMGTLELSLGGSSYPVQAPINVLQELTTAVRRMRKAGVQ